MQYEPRGAPGNEAAAAVRRGVGGVRQAVDLAQLGPGALAGFGDALGHAVQLVQRGLAGEQHGGLRAAAGRVEVEEMTGAVNRLPFTL